MLKGISANLLLSLLFNFGFSAKKKIELLISQVM
jgi:hypothetical protein